MSLIVLRTDIDRPLTWDEVDTNFRNLNTDKAEVNLFQAKTEKGVANGYAALDSGVLVPAAQLGAGTPDGTKFLRDDRVWASTSVVTNSIVDATSFYLRSL